MKHTLLSIFLILTIGLSFGQKNQSLSNLSDDNYYDTFWKANLDSLLHSWIISNNGNASQTKLIAEGNAINPMEIHSYKKYYRQLSDSLPFAYTDRVDEILNLYLSRKKDVGFALAFSKYMEPAISSILQQKELPHYLANLPFALSAFNSKSRNKMGSGGAWLMMYANARRQGLQVDSYIDERRDYHTATNAAIDEIDGFFTLYKDWGLALAAYSCGPTNVNKSIRRNNNNLLFDSIYSTLPDYGRDVVPALIAATILTEFHKDLGVQIPDLNFAIPVDTIAVSQRLHFIQIQDIMHIPIEELRYLNPKYKYDIVPAVNEVFHIYLPAGKLAEFNELEDSIYHYKDTVLFNLKKPVILPPAAKGRHYARYEPELPPDNSTLLYYTIKSGDNLGYIASWYGVKVREIEDWNNIYDPRRLKLGKKLKIYVPDNKAAYYREVDKMSFEQKQKRVGKTVSSSQSASHAAKKEEPLGKDFFWYTVKSGESPYTIAKKYPGVSSDDILRWNNITNARNIRVGQKLKIKRIK